MKTELLVERREFGPGNPLIVAELSCNHGGSFERAVELILTARQAGADAVKFQAFTPEQLTVDSSDEAFTLQSGPWSGQSLWDLYTEARTPLDWLEPLYKEARDIDLIPICSVFDVSTLPMLEDLGTEVYKIASPEAECRDLVKAVADTRKYVAISDGVTGKVYFPFDVAENMIRLRCSSQYPASPEDYGLSDRHGYPSPWGISDHTVDRSLWAVAASLGASMIEAHLMLPVEDYYNDETGVHDLPLDRGHSFLPFEFELAVQSADKAAEIAYTLPHEGRDVEFRRRWVWTKAFASGHKVADGDLVALRARIGQPASEPAPVGKRLKADVRRHEPLLKKQVK